MALDDYAAAMEELARPPLAPRPPAAGEQWVAIDPLGRAAAKPRRRAPSAAAAPRPSAPSAPSAAAAPRPSAPRLSAPSAPTPAPSSSVPRRAERSPPGERRDEPALLPPPPRRPPKSWAPWRSRLAKPDAPVAGAEHVGGISARDPLGRSQ